MSCGLSTAEFDAVIFDMDGVITDTARVHAAAWKATFDEFLDARGRMVGESLEPFSDADYLAFVDGRPRDDGVARFLESRRVKLPRGESTDGPNVESVWGLANRKNRAFIAEIERAGVQPFPTSVQLVRDLQTAGVGTAIISASRNARRILAAAGIDTLFPVRVDGIELERLDLPGKPAPDMFLEAARRLGVAPARTVVVEDAIAGVEAGRRGRFGLVIGVDRAGRGDDLRAHGADVVVTDLGECSVVA
ncbi:MAG TPA: beta-phosphoglucomutase family hydrolase [Acidimicrobiia bacterium]|nr:beta-phosphoglucomutase family hydrolase [Acidimicrobiia bacterium]